MSHNKTMNSKAQALKSRIKGIGRGIKKAHKAVSNAGGEYLHKAFGNKHLMDIKREQAEKKYDELMARRADRESYKLPR